jgi:hypothetical protein
MKNLGIFVLAQKEISFHFAHLLLLSLILFFSLSCSHSASHSASPPALSSIGIFLRGIFRAGEGEVSIKN